jgi:hypothetical protein
MRMPGVTEKGTHHSCRQITFIQYPAALSLPCMRSLAVRGCVHKDKRDASVWQVHDPPRAVHNDARPDVSARWDMGPHKQEHRLTLGIGRQSPRAALNQVRLLLPLQYLHLSSISLCSQLFHRTMWLSRPPQHTACSSASSPLPALCRRWCGHPAGRSRAAPACPAAQTVIRRQSFSGSRRASVAAPARRDAWPVRGMKACIAG